MLILIRIFVREKEMNMKRIYWLFLVALVVLVQYSCRSEDKTYGEQKEHEREVVSRFINRNVVMMMGNDTLLNLGKIKVITEEEFDKQDSTTNVDNNEFVLFSQSGIYMQIVREGNGKRIEPGESRRLACRFWEYNMMGDSLQLTNCAMKFAVSPEYINVSNNSGYINGSFDLTVPTGSLVYKAYGDAQVPDGWLKPLEYLRVGPQTSDEGRIAKVRLIVPHSSGHSHATASVYPCFYELTFQEL